MDGDNICNIDGEADANDKDEKLKINTFCPRQSRRYIRNACVRRPGRVINTPSLRVP